MNKQNNINNVIKIAVFIFFMCFPIIDCLKSTTIKNIEILNISIIEFIKYILILTIFVLTLFRKKNFKSLWPITIYSLFFFVYIVIHNINIMNFDKEIYIYSSINVITETYYILRIFYLPIFLIHILFLNRDILNIKYYSKIVKSIILMSSLSIILFNIFKISYASYGANEFVKYNIFNFFNSGTSYRLLSTRGLFDSANEISAIFLMLLPINIFLLYKEKKVVNYITYALQVIAMIIVGTRTSSFGSLLVSGFVIIINFILRLFKKEKLNHSYNIIAFLSCAFFCVSPFGLYYMSHDNSRVIIDQKEKLLTELEDIKSQSKIKNNQAKKNNKFQEYIKQHIYEFGINEAFIILYPIENDIEFWAEVAKKDRSLNNDSRIMKLTIIDRIKEKNNNKSDTYFGIGYTINFLDAERDYVYQYYLFGIVGIILFIMPYFVSIICAVLYYLKNIRKIDLMSGLLTAMGCLLGLIIPYLSGHVFGWSSPMFFLALSMIIINQFVYETKEKNINKFNNKKVLFLQLKGNITGGVWYVNKTLGEELQKSNYDVEVLGIRSNLDFGSNKTSLKVTTINSNHSWEFIQKKDLKDKKIIKKLHLLIKAIFQKIKLYFDYVKMKNYILEISPNYIIASHYLTLKGIPSSYLKRTIYVNHSSFGYLLDDQKGVKTLKKNQKRLYSLCWLSKSTMKKAMDFGFSNSKYIYNPVRFNSKNISDVLKEKKLIVISRISSEKRIDLMIKIVNELFKERKKNNWKFEIYGSGEFSDYSLDIINKNKQIKYCGETATPEKVLQHASIALNTSIYEGFSLSMIEANYFGVPVVSFDYGESAKEQIKQGKTGFIIEMNNEEEYKNKLNELMNNEKMLVKFSKDAKTFSKQFEVSKIVKEWILLFEKMNKERR